ncbi:MAG: SDR family NAD(P)-dependent oxidoreductase [Calditrichaeota bacterium]|nr:SDR family NAD(P)-dependent oxidoreductase [Candidatus Cloacimonadota bacterium]MCA9786518.1 SDR family NAD(P)-dependent oxidoreductase [Candidatus Cloacimonadota bacterium]MCB1045648.1 SDR family NAD(P)-dependent oxidoreductase [Calditrichota bacterium]MCB9474630.1 SDR family NAD(P)-dependent oxidoreductase [Candidatus Delongbacteria bacterium]
MSGARPWPAGELALITGASSGIGRELALALAAGGADLMLCARRGERLLELKQQLEKAHGVQVLLFQGDLSRAATIRDLLEVVESLEHKPGILVNNAARGLEEFRLDGSPGMARMLLELNINGPLALTRALLPAMVTQGRGWILNIASFAGMVPLPGHALYSASKHALLGFGQALHHELKGSGVQLTTCCPGLVDTEFFEAGDLRFRPATSIPAADVARGALKALARGQALLVLPASTRWSAWMYTRLPGFLQRRVLDWICTRSKLTAPTPAPPVEPQPLGG